MNKTDLVNQIAKETGLTKKKSRVAVNAFFSSIISGLQRDQEVVIAGFCIFEVRERGEYLAVNPKTRECVYVPELKFPRNSIHPSHATIRNSVSTKDFCGGLVGFGQTPLKSSSNAASAMIRRTSEKAKLVRPFTLCRRLGSGFKLSA